jgi:hypothetical protein
MNVTAYERMLVPVVGKREERQEGRGGNEMTAAL